MVARKEWMLLCLVAIRSSKAMEKINDGNPVEDYMQYEVAHDSIEQPNQSLTDPVLLSSSEPKDGQSSHGLDYVYPNKQDGNPTSITGPLCVQPKAEMKPNLARERPPRDQGKLVAIISKRERVRKLFKFFEQNQEKMEQFGNEAGGKSIPTVLKELNEIKNDIDGYFQVQLRKWAALEKPVPNEASKSEDTERHPHEMGHDAIEKDAKLNSEEQGQQHKDYRIASYDSERSPMALGESSQPDLLRGGNSLAKVLESTENKIEGQKLEAMHSELRDHALEIVYDRLMEMRFKNLIYLLYSVTFPELGKIIEVTEAQRNPIRKLRLGFEKSMFQAIQFMDEFGLIVKEAFEDFLSDTRVHELIGNHLVELFHVAKHGTYNHPLAFIPDMDLLSKHWKTVHLHKILITLNKSQKAHIIYTSLIAQISTWTESVARQVKFSRPLKIRKKFLDGKVLTELETWLEKESDTNTPNTRKDSALTKLGRKIVDFFQNPDSVSPYSDAFQDMKETEFYLNYYILSFIKIYHEKYLRSLFKEDMEYETLSKQLEIFQQAIKADMLIKQGFVYECLIAGNSSSFHLIPLETAMTQIPRIKKEFQLTCDIYRELKDQLEKLSPGFNHLKIWLDSTAVSSGLVEKFSRKFNQIWKEVMEGEAVRVKQMREADKELEANPRFPLDAFRKIAPVNSVFNF